MAGHPGMETRNVGPGVAGRPVMRPSPRAVLGPIGLAPSGSSRPEPRPLASETGPANVPPP